MEKFKPMRFDKEDLIFEKGQKSREIFLNIKGEMINMGTNRVFHDGAMIGQDDIIFTRDRMHTFKAGSELYTLRLEKEIFDKMLKEFPDMKAQLMKQANINKSYELKEHAIKMSMEHKDGKKVIRKFNE